jgi:DNA helicase II / ATP-dependent DNA helicase PcrA
VGGPLQRGHSTSSHSGPLEVELTRRSVPFIKFGGLKFLDSAHVKDLLAILRFAQNPRDRVAGFRALQLVPDVGPGKAGKILDQIATEPVPMEALTTLSTPPKAPEWHGLLSALATTSWPDALGHARAWYEPQLERMHEDAELRRGDLLQLEQIAAGFPSRERFLTDLTLDPPERAAGHAADPLKDEDYLILSTIHSAKGQEWRSVFVLNVVDGCIPSDLAVGQTDEIEEERRLLYVAMTRAKDQLTLGVPLKFYVTQQAKGGDRHIYASRSRFITLEMLDRFDCTHWAEAVAGESARPTPPKINVAHKLRGMWQ